MHGKRYRKIYTTLLSLTKLEDKGEDRGCKEDISKCFKLWHSFIGCLELVFVFLKYWRI